jgi:transglutaminase-like putative cysteine protease
MGGDSKCLEVVDAEIQPSLFTKVVEELKQDVESVGSGNVELGCRIQEFVNNNFEYEYYSNNKKNFKQVWNDRQGNCVDLACVSVCLFDCAGFPVRTMVFDGKVNRHMTVQVGFLNMDNKKVVTGVKQYCSKPGQIRNYKFSYSSEGWFFCDPHSSTHIGDVYGAIADGAVKEEGSSVVFPNAKIGFCNC